MTSFIDGEAPREVIERLQILLSTPKGTVCYDRKFGIDIGVLDLPLPIARVKYLAECVEAIKRYEPEVMITDTVFSYDESLDGRFQLKLVVKYDG